jgi:hypothetical protein
MKKVYKMYNKMYNKIYKIVLRMRARSTFSAAVPFAATTFNLTRGDSFWNAVTRFTPSAFW